jgi:gamma-glutamyltranspeptidase/glutathione hydrolase
MLLSVSSGLAGAQQPDLSPARWPAGELATYDSLTRTWGRRSPLATGQKGAIAGVSAAAAVRAGFEALKQGGTAMDAVLTHSLADIVLMAECCVSHAGFMTLVYYEAKSGTVHSMNAAWGTPLGENDPLGIPRTGGRTAMVPGYMAGAEAAHKRFGKLPWATLFEPAIYFAEQGFVLNPVIAGMIASKKEVLSRLPATKAVFTRDDGQWYQTGDRFKQTALAQTLRQVASHGADYLYRGEWGKKLVAAVQADGGKMTMKDLESYRPIWSEPAHTKFRDYDVYATGLPNTGGVNLIEALNLAELADLPRYGHYTKSAEALYRLMRIARVGDLMGTSITARGVVPVSLFQRYAADVDLSPAGRISKESAARVWADMQKPSWSELDREAFGSQGRDASGHSDCVVAVDAAGNVAALLHTINTGTWGSTGIMIDGVAIADPAAWQQPAVARAGPGNHMADPTNPVIVLKNGKPVLASSSIDMGLHEATLQSVLNILEWGMDPATAADTAHFGRPIVGPGAADVGSQVVFEGAFAPALLDSVRAKGIDIKAMPARQASGSKGGWVGVTLDPATGLLKAAAIRYYNGLALAY